MAVVHHPLPPSLHYAFTHSDQTFIFGGRCGILDRNYDLDSLLPRAGYRTCIWLSERVAWLSRNLSPFGCRFGKWIFPQYRNNLALWHYRHPGPADDVVRISALSRYEVSKVRIKIFRGLIQESEQE